MSINHPLGVQASFIVPTIFHGPFWTSLDLSSDLRHRSHDSGAQSAPSRMKRRCGITCGKRDWKTVYGSCQMASMPRHAAWAAGFFRPGVGGSVVR